MTSHLSENEAEHLQNGDVHLAQIPDFEMGNLENHFGPLRSVMARSFAFFKLFHLSLTFFDRSFPFSVTNNKSSQN